MDLSYPNYSTLSTGECVGTGSYDGFAAGMYFIMLPSDLNLTTDMDGSVLSMANATLPPGVVIEGDTCRFATTFSGIRVAPGYSVEAAGYSTTATHESDSASDVFNAWNGQNLGRNYTQQQARNGISVQSADMTPSTVRPATSAPTTRSTTSAPAPTSAPTTPPPVTVTQAPSTVTQAPSTVVVQPPVSSVTADQQVANDHSVAESTIGQWLPQISSKQDGPAAMARFVLSQATYPDVFVIWSNDYSTFSSQNYYVALVPREFDTAAGANGWCDSQGFTADNCFARRLSHIDGPEGNSVQR